MYLVYAKNKRNGVTYVYEAEGRWDSEKRQSRGERKCIGKLDPATGELVLSKRSKAETASRPAQTGPVPTLVCNRRFYGATYLFDAIGEKLGLAEDLAACFPDLHRQILSIAYYLILEDRNPLSRFPRWATTHVHPYGEDIPSQRSSELFASVDEDSKQRFFRRLSKRRLEKEYLAYDTTSVSSYSKSLKQVRYGHNKEHEPLQQINLALLFGEGSRLPVYYRKLPGNITDVRTIRNLLADIDFLEPDNQVSLVMDRGFYSEENINALYRNHYKFLIAARTGLKLVQSGLDAVRGTLASRPNYSSRYKLYYTSGTVDWKYTETKPRSGKVETGTRRMYLHLFYNDQRATDDKNDFNDMLDQLENELVTGSRKPENEKLYDKYYEIRDTPARGISLTPKQSAIDEAEKDYGYFALLSNGIKDPLEALNVYRSKDMIEKAFGNLKERLSLRRTSVWSSDTLEGKLFVQFIALIYLSYIKKAMNDHDLFGKYTLQELLDDLDVIERYELPARRHRIGEMTKKQEELYGYFDVAVPR